MNKRKLGRTDLHISELCLDTAHFHTMDETESFALLDAYYACGGSFIQSLGEAGSTSATSPRGEGSSELIVGRWHEQRGIRRDSLVLASRINFFRPSHGGSVSFANLVREACERSLRRLRAKHLDLLICDWSDALLPLDDVRESVDMLVRAGLVRYAVAGGFPAWRVVDSLHRSKLRNHARFEALQAEYTLRNPGQLDDALALCRELRLGFLATSPVGELLAQRARGLQDFNPVDELDSEHSGGDVGEAVLRPLSQIADKRLATPAQIALAWVLSNPQVSAAVISPSTPREVRELSCAAKIILTSAEVAALTNAATDPERSLEFQYA